MPALAHLLPIIGQQHALVHEPGKGFGEANQPLVIHHLGPKPRIQQVHHCVLRAAHIQVDRKPVVNAGSVERCLVVVRAGVAQLIP